MDHARYRYPPQLFYQEWPGGPRMDHNRFLELLCQPQLDPEKMELPIHVYTTLCIQSDLADCCKRITIFRKEGVIWNGIQEPGMEAEGGEKSFVMTGEF